MYGKGLFVATVCCHRVCGKGLSVSLGVFGCLLGVLSLCVDWVCCHWVLTGCVVTGC